MTRLSLAMVVLLGAMACRDGIPATALLEPIPALETCQFDGSTVTGNEAYVDFEWGRVEAGAFVPLAGGEEVEMQPVPRGTMRQWFAFVAVRARPTAPLPPTVCAFLDQAILFLPDPNAEVVPEGLLLHRQPDGSYVNGQVPLFLGTRRATESGFDPLVRQPVTLHSEGGYLPGPDGPLRLYGPRVEVQPVNHEGFLSTPRPTPDAGTFEVTLGLVAQVSKTLLAPGETANVELRLSGQRRGNDVTLAVEGLPPGVTLTLTRTVIPGAESDSEAELTSGLLEVQPGAPAGPFTLRVTASGGGVTASDLLEVQIFQGPTNRTVTLSATPVALTLAPGTEQAVTVRLTPFGGFSGQVYLKALAPADLELTLEPPSLLLSTPTDVTVRVKLLGAAFPNASSSFQLIAVSGREQWALQQTITTTSLAPPAPVPYVLSPLRERRVVLPDVAFDWALQVGAAVGAGQTPPAVTLTNVAAPTGCGSGVFGATVRLVCDPTFSGAADVVVTASSSAGGASTTLRVVSANGALVLPEVTPQLWDSQRPEVAGAPDGTLAVAQETGLGLRFATVSADGGVGAYQQEFGNVAALVATPAGVRRLVLRNQTLSCSGKDVVRTDTQGPFAAAADVDGTLWVAAGALVNAQPHPAVSSSAPGVMAWTARDLGLAGAGVTTDLALSVRSGAAVLASVESDAVVVRGFGAGQWTALPAVPSPAVPRAASSGRGPDRVVALAHDGLDRPVLAFVGADEQLHVLRLEGSAWVVLGGAVVGAGLLPLSLALSVDPAGRVVLAWHEATHRLVANSGQRVVPAHVTASALRWARLESGASFTALPTAGLDQAKGAHQQPFVSVDAQGRPVLAWVEDGRVVLRRGPP